MYFLHSPVHLSEATPLLTHIIFLHSIYLYTFKSKKNKNKKKDQRFTDSTGTEPFRYMREGMETTGISQNKWVKCTSIPKTNLEICCD